MTAAGAFWFGNDIAVAQLRNKPPSGREIKQIVKLKLSISSVNIILKHNLVNLDKLGGTSTNQASLFVFGLHKFSHAKHGNI